MPTLKALRLRIAQAVAPAGADVHDPDDTACPNDRLILEAAEAWDLSTDADGRVWLDVTSIVKDFESFSWVSPTNDPDDNVYFGLIDAGHAELARLRDGKES